MDNIKQKTLIREGLILVLFLFPIATITISAAVFVEIVEGYFDPGLWGRLEESAFFLLVFGYPIYWLIRFVVWGAGVWKRSSGG